MDEKKIVVAVSGYYDPIHVGHLENLKLAKELGDKLVVIVNNTKQAILKKGYEFMPFEERIGIVKSIKYVDDVFPSIDEDKAVCESLRAVKPDIFAKGGDRHSGEIPESDVCNEFGIKIIDGLGAKVQSSSDLVERSKKLKS